MPSEKQFEKDPILKEGYTYRKRAWIVFQLSIIGFLAALLINNFMVYIFILALNLFGFSYMIRYKLWWQRNEEQLIRNGWSK